MPRKKVKATDRVKFSENKDGTYDLFVNGRIWAYDVDAEDFKATLKRFGAPFPCSVQVEDLTGYAPRVHLR